MNATLREQLLPFATGTQKACARKMRYETEKQAWGVIRARATAEPAALYSYPCTHCGGWHITRMKPPA